MEFCDRHDGVHVYYDYHRTWQADCPLCTALDAIEEKEHRIEDLANEVETLQERLSEMETDAAVVAEHYEKRIAAMECVIDGLREAEDDYDSDFSDD